MKFKKRDTDTNYKNRQADSQLKKFPLCKIKNRQTAKDHYYSHQKPDKINYFRIDHHCQMMPEGMIVHCKLFGVSRLRNQFRSA